MHTIVYAWIFVHYTIPIIPSPTHYCLVIIAHVQSNMLCLNPVVIMVDFTLFIPPWNSVTPSLLPFTYIILCSPILVPLVWSFVLFCLSTFTPNLFCPVLNSQLSPWVCRESCKSFGMIVTLLASIAHKFESSKSLIRHATVASCACMNAMLEHLLSWRYKR